MMLPGAGVVKRIAIEAHAVATLFEAGMLSIESPPKMVKMARHYLSFGGVGGAIGMAAVRHGDRVALIDELGPLSFVEMDRRSNALVDSWHRRGIGAGDGIGILCRNHRGFLDVTFACAKIGGRALYLNTDFSGPQAADVGAREGVDVLVYDEEFAGVVGGVDAPKGRFQAWTDTPGETETLESLIAAGDPAMPKAPAETGSIVLLTSGTTGLPKGAPRPATTSLAIPAAVLGSIPFRGGEGMYVAPPFFHTWGLLGAVLSISVGATLVTRRRFEPATFLRELDEHRCGSAMVVPVMLKRLLALGKMEIGAHDLSALRVIACGGAQLEGPLASRTMDAFGDVLYVVYGSTECGDATIAVPADLRAAPSSVGKPPFGITVRILDDAGLPLPAGRTGRIFVGNTMSFDGYTGGGKKEVIDGLMSTGDVGHFDGGGRLHIDGRDDDMVVSGGENVFPQEVENLLAGHDAVHDAAVVGVDDEEFGKALRAFVVRRPDTDLDEAAVRGYVKDNLARYKVPRSVVFLDELPRNPAGKVLKRVLREWTAKEAAPGDGN